MYKEITPFIASDSVSLDRMILGPNSQEKGTLIFTTGWSGHYNDYFDLLIPLAEEYRVVATNHRGHGASGGTLTQKNLVSDLVELYEAEEGPRAYVGHSIGSLAIDAARITNPHAMVLFSPFIEKRYMALLTKRSFAVLKKNPWLKMVDYALLPLQLHKTHLHMKKPFMNTSGVIDMKLFNKNITRTLIFVPGKDKVFGTNNPEQRSFYQRYFQSIGCFTEDASALADDLNHCFNYKGRQPFLRPEQNKEKTKKSLIDHTLSFLDKHLKPS